MKCSFNHKFLILFVLCIVSSNVFGQYTKWEKDITYNNIEFKKLRFRNDGNESVFANGILKQKTVIEDYPCYKMVFLSKEGRLKIFILAEDFEVAGNKFKKETRIAIGRNNGFHINCLYESEVQGYQIRRTNYKRLLFMGSTNFQLYPSGKLKFFQPVNEIEIQGVWCKPSAVRGGVSLYENGKLKECTSANEQKIQGQLVSENFTLKFNETGKLIYAKKEKIFGD